jgi:hypothetical protein
VLFLNIVPYLYGKVAEVEPAQLMAHRDVSDTVGSTCPFRLA